MEKVCSTIANAGVTETCEWVRSTFVQFSKAAHVGEANHYEPRTVMHFMNEKHEPAFDIVLNFGYRYDSRTFYSKKILFGMPTSEKLEGHKTLTDLLDDYKVTCVEVAEYWNENDFMKNFADDYKNNIVLHKPADVATYKNELTAAVIKDAKYTVDSYSDLWEDEVPEFTLDDILNDSEGNVADVIKRAEEDGIDLLSIIPENKIIDLFTSACKRYAPQFESCDLEETDDSYSLTEAEVNREQTNNLQQILLKEFINAGWDSIEFSFGGDNEISIIPKFDSEEKNEDTVKEFIVKINGKISKNLCAQTIDRLARQIADFRNNLFDPEIHINVKLSGVTYNGANGKQNIQDNIRSCEKGDAVKLVRIKNIHAYADVDANDETAVEVRTLDNKALGYLPKTLTEKDRIARKLVQHKPYTAKVYSIVGGFGNYKNVGIVISIDFD